MKGLEHSLTSHSEKGADHHIPLGAHPDFPLFCTHVGVDQGTVLAFLQTMGREGETVERLLETLLHEYTKAHPGRPENLRNGTKSLLPAQKRRTEIAAQIHELLKTIHARLGTLT